MNGEIAVVSDALHLKTSIPANAETAARIWANRQSPASNCLVSNAGDQTTYASTGEEVIGGFKATKKVYADGNVVWSAPDLDCADVGQFTPTENDLDAKLELVGSSVGVPDPALFLIDGFNEVSPSDFDIAVENHAASLTGRSQPAEYFSTYIRAARTRNEFRDAAWQKWQSGR